MPTHEMLKKNTFLEDNFQNPDQQGENGREGLMQGDIVASQSEILSNRDGLLSSRWPYNIWPYVISWEQIPGPYRLWVKLQFHYVLQFEYKHKLGDCIHLCERSECPDSVRNSPNYARFTFENSGCWSTVGMSPGVNHVNLAFPGCIGVKGTIAHEIMHSLGFYHEHTRPDRGFYVIINRRNIMLSKIHNFDKQSVRSTDMYDYYDWNSVMHYDAFAFRNDRHDGISSLFTRTLYPNPTSFAALGAAFSHFKGTTMGQRLGLSFCDELKIRRHYSKPGLEGGKVCKLWNARTCRCKFINTGDEYNKENCEELVANDALNNITQRYHSSSSRTHLQCILLLIVLSLYI